MLVDNTADNADITQPQAANHHRLLSHVTLGLVECRKETACAEIGELFELNTVLCGMPTIHSTQYRIQPYLWLPIITPACVQLRSCVSVCPRSNRKTAWAINTKLGTRIHYSSRSKSIDPEVKRSKVKVTQLRKLSRSTVASDHGRYPETLCCATCGCCRRGSACRYDCLCFLLFGVFTLPLYRDVSDPVCWCIALCEMRL